MDKRTFIGYKDRIDYTEEMSFEEMWKLFNAILCYQNWKEIWELWNVKFVWSRIKKEFEADTEKYEKICEANSEKWKKHKWNQYTQGDVNWKAQKNTVEQMEQNGTNGTHSDSDSEYSKEICVNKLTHKESLWEDNKLEERKEKSCEKKKRKKVEYTEDYENIWKIYPQNWWTKEKIFKLWLGYDEDRKEKLLFWAKTVRLHKMTWWKYVQRMDRWMEGYTPWNEFEKLCEVKRIVDNLWDDTLKQDCYHELREMFGDEMNRKVAFATARKMEFEWH